MNFPIVAWASYSYKADVRRLLILGLLAGCTTGKPGACIQVKAASPAPEASTSPTPKKAGSLILDGELGLQTLDGRPANLKDYKAPVTVFAFWATWCHPCLEELPYVEKLHQLYKDDREVSIVGVSVDRPGALELAKTQIADLKLTFPVLFDSQWKLIKQFTEQIHIPLLVFIDRDGKIYSEFGFSEMRAVGFVSNKGNLIELARGGHLPD